MTTAIKSVSLSLEFVDLIEKHKISLSEACRIGISVILSDLGEPQFLNRTNYGRKVQRLVQNVEELNRQLNEFENVLEQK